MSSNMILLGFQSTIQLKTIIGMMIGFQRDELEFLVQASGDLVI